MAEINVLLVEDSDSDALLVGTDNRFSLRHVQTISEACEHLCNGESTDVIVLDLNLPDSQGLESFTTLDRQFSEIPIVILSGQDDEQSAIEAVGLGAQDYVPKADLDTPILVRSLLYAIERNGRQLAERRNLLMELDLATAQQIQQHLLPSVPPKLTGFDVAFVYQPSESCSGDLFDFIPIGEDPNHPEKPWDVLIADVSSHGFGPALIMVGARRMLRTCAQMRHDVGEILTITNHALVEDTLEDQFLTLFYARLDPAKRSMTYCSAGHPAWIITPTGTADPLEYSGLPLGILPGREYHTDGSRILLPNEIVLLMTDGAFEAIAHDGEPFGQDRVFELIHQHRESSAEDILRILLERINRFCLPEVPKDDVAIVLLKVLD